MTIESIVLEDEELIENTIGNTTGQLILKVDASDLYIVNVQWASGDWKITIEYQP